MRSGCPFVDAVLLGPLSRENVDLLWDVSRIFLLMGLAWTMLAPLIAVVMSQGITSGSRTCPPARSSCRSRS